MKYSILYDEDSVRDYFQFCGNEVAFDTESTGLALGSPILGLSFYNPTNGAVFIPTNTYFKGCLSTERIVEILNDYTPFIKGVAHNAKYDWGVFENVGLITPKLLADTIAMVHSYDPNAEKNLEKRVYEDFGVRKQKFEEIIKKKWDKINWKTDVAKGIVTLEALAEYSCEDTFYTWKLWKYYTPKLEKEDLLKIHDRIELPLIEVLKSMYMRGVNIDKEYLLDLDEKITEKLTSVVDNIYDEAGCVFNLNSPKQKANVLFDKLKLPSYKTTKTGARATDSDVYDLLAQDGYDIGKYLQEYSTLQKLSSGYSKAIPQMIYADGRLRCNFNSLGTATGRFSSNNPNLQNQPNNKDFSIRKAFIPTPGYKLLIADYSQIELRVMAHASGDKRFMEAFLSGEDIHGKVGRDLGIERKFAKVVNFGVLYGMGFTKLGHTLGISEKEAKNIITNYERTYTGYYEWKIKTEKFAERNHYIKTLFGRVRRLPAIASGDKRLYFGSLRQAVNTVIQGSAADIIKIAMINLFNEYKTKNLDAHLMLQVHDELINEAIQPQCEEAYAVMKHVMENSIKLSVPLEVDGKICDNWGQMKDDSFTGLIIPKVDTPIYLF